IGGWLSSWTAGRASPHSGYTQFVGIFVARRGRGDRYPARCARGTGAATGVRCRRRERRSADFRFVVKSCDNCCPQIGLAVTPPAVGDRPPLPRGILVLASTECPAEPAYPRLLGNVASKTSAPQTAGLLFVRVAFVDW